MLSISQYKSKSGLQRMSQNTVHLSQLIRKKNFAESEKIIISFIIDIVNKGGIKVRANGSKTNRIDSNIVLASFFLNYFDDH
jgi:RNA:NAD 2'-phosphotransferase (TPT1/KptA family)